MRLMNIIAPGGMRAKLSILIYHRVLLFPDPVIPDEITEDSFKWQMSLCAKKFNVIPLSEAIIRMHDGTLPPRTVCITFDDGYSDNETVALPILEELNINATFFIATGYLDGGIMWNDVIIESVKKIKSTRLDLTNKNLGLFTVRTLHEKYLAINSILQKIKHKNKEERQEIAYHISELSGCDLPMDLMMSSKQVTALSNKGMEIGAHTVTHPILAKLTLKQAKEEIVNGKDQLEELTGKKIILFAYPNGKYGKDYNEDHVNLVRRVGFTGAVTTEWGVSDRFTDPWQLRRFTPWDRRPGKFMYRMLQNYWKKYR